MWEKLKRLHLINGWTITVLMVTGILLFWPSLRGPLAPIRVPLKFFHIGIGVLSVLVLAVYVPFFKKHWKRIKKQQGKKVNLVVIICFILIWAASGTVLALKNDFSPDGVQFALHIHDLFTWFGIPIVVYHSVTRLRWVQKQRKPMFSYQDDENVESVIPLSRRGFIQWLVGTIVVLIIGPSFYKWFKSLSDDGGKSFQEAIATGDKNNMSPLPVPAAASNPPAGGGYEGMFRVYTVTEIPAFTDQNWSFKIDGLVDRPQTFTWKEFVQLSRKVQISDFHCVTGWSVNRVTYEGIPLSALLNQAGVQPKAKYVKFYSGDGVYTDALSLDQAHMDDVMVAMLMDGHLIPSDFGGPVRLIVPKMYAYKSVKWLVRMELVDKPHLGYWQVRGYDTDAWVKKA